MNKQEAIGRLYKNVGKTVKKTTSSFKKTLTRKKSCYVKAISTQKKIKIYGSPKPKSNRTLLGHGMRDLLRRWSDD